MPQFYLRAFADPKGRVTVFDRRGRRSFTASVGDVAAEVNLYTIPDERGDPTDEVEQQLSALEDAIAPSVAKLLDRDPRLDGRDLGKVAAFVALQFVRTVSMREHLENILDLKIRMMVEANLTGDPPQAVERFIERRYAEHPDELKEQIRRTAAAPDRPITLSTEAWTADFVPLVQHLGLELIERDWWLACSDDRAFATCDDPVILTAEPAALEFGVGIANAAQVLLPVSPHRVLVMDGYGGDNLRLVPVDRTWIRWVNGTVANRANRHVFWHPRSDPLEGVTVPPLPRPSSVNGFTVERGERSWDKLRPHKLPHMLRVRDEIRAGKRGPDDMPRTDREG